MTWSSAALTMAGRRPCNEDRIVRETGFGMFAVIDGVAGRPAGAAAAAIAAAPLSESAADLDQSPPDLLRNAFRATAQRLAELEASEPRTSGAACVVTAALIREGMITVAQIGNARFYSIGDGGIVPLTVDHTPVGEMLRANELCEQEARLHPQKHTISRWLSAEETDPGSPFFADLYQAAAEPGRAYLMTTDGIHDILTAAELEHTVRELSHEPGRAVRALADQAIVKGSRDNVSAVLIVGEKFPARNGQRLTIAAPSFRMLESGGRYSGSRDTGLILVTLAVWFLGLFVL